MKFFHKAAATAALALAAIYPSAALAEVVQTPLESAVVVSGNTVNTSSGQCGYTTAQPTQIIRVTENFTSLRFRVESDGEPTLLITGPSGHTQCVMSDRISGNAIEVPGVWEEGVYSLHVGDREQGNYAYTLFVSQE